jgi:hypothetical protein
VPLGDPVWVTEDEKDISYRSWGLLTGMVSYARPFTQSTAYGTLEEKWSKFDGRPDLERHDLRLIQPHRNTLLAHNDLTPHQEVVAFSSGGILQSSVGDRGAVADQPAGDY